MEELHVHFLCCFVLGCGLIYYEGQKLKGKKLQIVSKNSLDGEYESCTHFFLNGLIIIKLF